MSNHLEIKEGRVTTDPLLLPYPSDLPSPLLYLLAKKFTGKFLLQEELMLPKPVIHLLLKESYFIPTKSIQTIKTTLKCMRCHNRKRHLFAQIECSRCKQRHLYCRSCIQMGRVLQCEKLYTWNGPAYPWPRKSSACQWKGQLTPAQQDAADRLVQAVTEKSDILCWAVTGAGKTEMIFPAIERAIREGGRVCIATPRTDVVRELYPRIDAAFPSVGVEALYGGSVHKDGDAQIIVSTTHQLMRYRKAFTLMIVDELDAFPYYNDPTLQAAVKAAKQTPSTTIYLTATPRNDFKRKIKRKELEVVFVPVRYHQHPLPLPKLQYVSKLQQSLQKNIVPKQVETWLQQHLLSKRQLLIFVATIDIADTYVSTLTKSLLAMKWIEDASEVETVHAHDEARANKIQAFREKKLRVLITTTILERGVTFPSVDVLILNGSHEVFDEAAIVQIAGRAGRSKADPKGEVVIFHEGLTDHLLAALDTIKEMNRRRQVFLQNRGGIV